MRELMELFAMLSAILSVMIHVAFAAGVYVVARRREDCGGPGNQFVSAFVWGVATLAGGVLVAAAYWLMHLSRLSDDNTSANQSARHADFEQV